MTLGKIKAPTHALASGSTMGKTSPDQAVTGEQGGRESWGEDREEGREDLEEGTETIEDGRDTTEDTTGVLGTRDWEIAGKEYSQDWLDERS